MDTTIYKYPLKLVDRQTVTLPEGSRILSVQVQKGEVVLYAHVRPAAPTKQSRMFAIYGTGNPVTHQQGEFIGTFQLYGGDLVFHLFEVFQ